MFFENCKSQMLSHSHLNANSHNPNFEIITSSLCLWSNWLIILFRVKHFQNYNFWKRYNNNVSFELQYGGGAAQDTIYIFSWPQNSAHAQCNCYCVIDASLLSQIGGFTFCILPFPLTLTMITISIKFQLQLVHLTSFED